MFLITGYVPAEKAEGLKDALENRYQAFAEFQDPGADEDVPVLLRNHPLAEPAESIVESYSLPGKGELDPTAIMAPFYYLLFGLMLLGRRVRADYGFRLPYIDEEIQEPEPRHAKDLKALSLLRISTAFWGFLFGSFFGDAVNIIATTFFDRRISVWRLCGSNPSACL